MATKKTNTAKKGNHDYHPPTDLPAQVKNYAEGLGREAATLGVPTGSSQAELAPLVQQAAALQPLAEEIAALERQLIAKKAIYNVQARPIWDAFQVKLEHARTDGKHNPALANFVKQFGARHEGHAASSEGSPTPPAPAPPPTPGNPTPGSGQAQP